ncbi:malto-oligosyltrehalose trehalohydrolase [Methylopila jiangsuensis]|uniref:Malto-oligosyltrehalose trehalohydrolase n=1 Tax=Methylopila jiangsuensis TaxID=586230 RepID=A0A9W6N1T1_9HYPH|nr:malto-oligosyltrehalose trehalohydrolase [Methylopila jiangsuensis]MDR6285446.1 malto-oligosyltrehalose trehalohydrolase [Methylopila jiangsuensis]GLK75204.1 malto-oligosyltrehalose trehalohydrolase [Methylopila jiangsuensis]
MTAAFARNLTFGAQFAPEATRFRFWAPAQNGVKLEVRGEPPTEMIRSEDGWFEETRNVPAGARYRFVLDDGLAVPDPASRLQDGDVHGWSVVVDPNAYAWETPDWRGRPWAQAVIYELHAGCFGGFDGVAEALPRLKALGITAVQLMPIADFPGVRNWGYDGVLPYAPDAAYGAPDQLKRLVDKAHALGLMMFLDVVYNHFGPDGNYIPAANPVFFRDDLQTPWGGAIDFRLPEVRRYFTENTLFWLMEYRFDGLRLDAVHAISEQDWIDEMAEAVRATVEPGRHVHLVLENEHNQQSHLAGEVDAQWNDDFHHVVHAALTGEREGYYADYAEDVGAKLARALSEGFVYQGEPSPHLDGRRRGTPSGHLPPTAFISFLQNHDQIGNRAFGDRLNALAAPEAVEAATAALLLIPQIPMLFMGEETASETPFLFFTDHEPDLAEAVRKGRRKEFAKFAAFAGAEIPDPNAVETFERSIPKPHPERAEARAALIARLLALRAAEIAPRIPGAVSEGAEAVGPAAAVARWRLGDGARLTLALNLVNEPASLAPVAGPILFETAPGAADALRAGTLPGRTTIALLERA